mgnify:CR=1 FL=1|tara:strand:+ start:530 stop:766 length:237 start_codon:yes stop_codon:yes gene_type:complete
MLFGLRIKNPKLLLIKILIIFLPIYLIAYFTQNMVYVLPSIAVGVIFGSNITDNLKKHSDEDGDMDEDSSDSSDASDG